MIDRRPLRDVEDEARLPHAGARGDDDEIRLLEPAGDLVEIFEGGRNARHERLLLVKLLDDLEARPDQLPRGNEAPLDPPLGHLEDAALGHIHDPWSPRGPTPRCHAPLR
jgi:hypothetical protein